MVCQKVCCASTGGDCVSVIGPVISRMPGLLAKDRIIAPSSYNRTLGVMYSLFFIFLGSSAAIFGRCRGFFISALGIYWHQIALLWLGSGVIAGVAAAG